MKSSRIRQLLASGGMILVLLGLCAVFSFLTIADQPVEGASGAAGIASKVLAQAQAKAPLLIAAGLSGADAEFLAEVERRTSGTFTIRTARDPAEARAALQQEPRPGGIAASSSAASWLVFDSVREKVIAPHPYRWPNFLKFENLRNIASQIAIIAILAIGMTLVILTGGIDLSVGSVVALTSVTAAWMLTKGQASPLIAALAAVLLGAALGGTNGVFVAKLRIPAFIATLALMQVARGLAFKVGEGQSISVSNSFSGLGRSFTLGLPNLALLMLGLYVLGHIIMTRTVLGRYIYALGSNPEAARFSGISLTRIRLLVYVVSGALAGLAGVAMTSQLLSGDPKTGQNFELTAIAAAVVGGTSLTGGKGTLFGTLTGALIIGVLENGLNQIGVNEYDRLIIIGLVILAAVLFDVFSSRRPRGARQREH